MNLLLAALLLALPLPAFAQALRPAPVRAGVGGLAAAGAAGASPTLSASPPSLFSPAARPLNAARPEDMPKPVGAAIPPGQAYAAVLSERGWAVHRTADAAYLLVMRRGADAHGRKVFVVDALDAADPAKGTVAHVDFAVHAEARQAVFDGPLDEWAKEPPVLPDGVAAGDLSHWREHLWFGLSVTPERRGRGLAGLLMDTASALARDAGAKELVIYATEDSRSLYRKLYAGSIGHESTSVGRDGEKSHRLLVKFPHGAADTPARDKTLRFLAALDLVRNKTAGPLPAALARTRILVVPGLFGNHVGDLYGGNLRRLQALGLRGEVLRVDTEGRTEAGLRRIEDAVRASPEPVVLVGHSRGGVMVHDWFRTAPAELKAKVARVVVFQSPISGTGFADWVLGSWWRRLVARLLGWRYWADLLKTIRELTPAARAAALASLPPWDATDLAKVWVLRSVKAPGPGLYGRHAGVLKALGAGETDGIVPAASAAVPGAADIILQDVDHSNTVLQKPGAFRRWRGYQPHPSYDAGDITEALLRLLFR
ncbi:MAG: GNAT family N-acetyltransferase [Elusimicrobia bacterium]|nr:GNAT family N-acetyltransferase [Elusimicrobiota bacterium]